MSTLALRNPRTLGSEPETANIPCQNVLESATPTTGPNSQDTGFRKSPSPDPSVNNGDSPHGSLQKRTDRKVSDPRMSVEMIAFSSRDDKRIETPCASRSPSVDSDDHATQTLSPCTLKAAKNLPSFHEKSPLRTAGAPLVRETLSSRRRHIPKPLDVNALRRERQYSGPYSAAPLLAQNQGFRVPVKNDTHPCSLAASEIETSESDPKKIRLPQMTSAPYVSSKLSHLPLPLCCPPTRAQPSIAPPVPASPASTLLSPQPPKSMISGGEPQVNSLGEKNGPFRTNRPRDISAWTPVSAHFDPKKRNKRLLSQAFEESATNQPTNDKKARFMILCEEMWNLFQE